MRRAILTLLLTAAAMFMAISSASAVDIPTGKDCLQVPIPASPSSAFDPGPDNPRDGNPFDPNSGVSKYEVYGWAGLEPISYDPGCNPVQLSWTPMAAAISGMAGTVAAIVTRLWRTATDGTIGTLFDPIQNLLGQVLGWAFFVPLVGFAVMATGAYFIWHSRKQRLSVTGRQAATSLLVVFVGVATLFYPLVLGPAVDRGVTVAVQAVNAAVASTSGQTSATVGDAIASNVQAYILYPVWELQTFGPGNTAAAQEFGPRLFAAKTFTRTEQKQLDADPSKAGEMIDAKQTGFKAAALEMEKKYPQAYQFLAGNQSANAMMQAILAFAGVLCATVFLIYSLWKIVYGLVLTRITIGVAPGLALIAQHPMGQHLFWRALERVWAALVAGVIAAVMAILFLVAGVGGILSATNVPGPIKLAALALMTVLMMRMMKMSSKRIKNHRGQLPAKMEPDKSKPQVFEPPQKMPSRPAAAAKGAATAAVSTAALGAITGGTVTAGAVAAGAAKGAAIAAAAPKPPTAAPTPTPPALPGPNGSSPTQPKDDPAPKPEPSPWRPSNLYTPMEPKREAPKMSKRPAPPPKPVEPTRVYTPSEPMPAKPVPAKTKVTATGTVVHRVYSPVVPR